MTKLSKKLIAQIFHVIGKLSVFLTAFQNAEDQNIKNNNLSCWFVWM
jgi:hypothetical protein